MTPVLAQDVLDQAEKAAHLSDKGLFIVVLILLGGVIAYLFRDAKKTAERVAVDHAESMKKLIEAMDERSHEMDAERQQRINHLLDVITANTAGSVKMADAILANTSAIHNFELMLNQVSQVLTLTKKVIE